MLSAGISYLEECRRYELVQWGAHIRKDSEVVDHFDDGGVNPVNIVEGVSDWVGGFGVCDCR